MYVCYNNTTDTMYMKMLWSFFNLVALKAKNDEYNEKPNTGYSNDKTLYELAWKVRELSDLNEGHLAVEAEVLSDKIADPTYTVGDNWPQTFSFLWAIIVLCQTGHKVSLDCSHSYSDCHDQYWG